MALTGSEMSFLTQIYSQYTLSCGVNKTYAAQSGQNFIITLHHLSTEMPSAPGTLYRNRNLTTP